MKKLTLRHLLYFFLSVSITIFSCKKNDIQIIIPDNSNPDLVTKVTATISGFVTDENDDALQGAIVRVGSAFLNTDQFGYFEIKNVDVNQTAATFSVSKNGYFKLTKTFMAKEGKASFFRLKLTPKTAIGTINATSGGNVSLSNGTIIGLPTDGVKDASTGAGYTGAITVYAHYIDPTAADIAGIMPGDLRGLRTNGDLNILDSYGMLEVELNGASGELLQMATGKTATLTMAIPASLTATAPATIPLWYFDETTGLWKEEGLANKVGNQYIGEVAHFSTWNCDNPRPHVPYHCRLVYSDGSPASNVEVRLLEENYYGGGTNHGFTDDNGEVFGGAPANARVRMEVSDCGEIIYSSNFNTSGQEVDFGQVTINSNIVHVSGQVKDCNNELVTNGKVFILNEGLYKIQYVNNGVYSCSFHLCNANSVVSIFAQNLNTSEQGNQVSLSVNNGGNITQHLTACGNSIAGSNMIWMEKDLNVVRYRNGDIIPEVKDSIEWRNLTTGAWCWYGCDSANNGVTYSRLYNWYAVNDPRGLAPEGWHIPSNSEWETFISYLGGYSVAGGKMKETGLNNWLTPNTGASNESGFTGLPTGIKYSNGVDYSGRSVAGYWWSSTEFGGNNVFTLWERTEELWPYYYDKNWGCAVRCLKD
jgi:uncharacterized protein (TIGR02145 family)